MRVDKLCGVTLEVTIFADARRQILLCTVLVVGVLVPGDNVGVPASRKSIDEDTVL